MLCRSGQDLPLLHSLTEINDKAILWELWETQEVQGIWFDDDIPEHILLHGDDMLLELAFCEGGDLHIPLTPTHSLVPFAWLMRQADGEAITEMKGVSINGSDGLLGCNGARAKQKE